MVREGNKFRTARVYWAFLSSVVLAKKLPSWHCCTGAMLLCSFTIAQQAPPIVPPIAPPIALAAPMPPPPALPAGLRGLLEGTGCVGACMERGEDWFESERPNLGVLSSVAAMVRAKLAENFLESLRPLEPAAEALVRSRLEAVAAQQHVQSGLPPWWCHSSRPWPPGADYPGSWRWPRIRAVTVVLLPAAELVTLGLKVPPCLRTAAL